MFWIGIKEHIQKMRNIHNLFLSCTQVKYLGSALICPTAGCETILESTYSSLFGVPLSLFGMLTYGAVAALAVSASIKQGKDRAEGFNGGVSRVTDLLILSGVTLLSTCSAELMYILNTQFVGDTCAWCYLSAGLSFSLLLAVVSGMGAERLSKEGAMPGAGALAAGLLTLYLGFGNVGSSNAEVSEVAFYVSLLILRCILCVCVTIQKSGGCPSGEFIIHMHVHQ